MHIGVGEEVVAAVECDTFSPDISPDGETLLYTAGQGLHLLDLESREERLLLGGEAMVDIWGSRWSPSGDRITLGMQRDIFIIRPDGTDLVRLTKTSAEGGAASHPAWIGDDEIVYSWHTAAENRWESRVIDLREGGERRLPVAIVPGNEISPDGRQVVEMGIDDLNTLLFVRGVDDATGATRRQLTFYRDP